MSSKRTERLVVMVSPAAWDQYAERASSLGMSVALWAARTLDKASVGPMSAAMSPDDAQAFVTRLLASLDSSE